MSEFEELLQDNLDPLHRYVYFKINNKYDADDVIQEVLLSATVKFPSLKNRSSFRAWLIGIAKHKCSDYYRKKANSTDVSLDALAESGLKKFSPNKSGSSVFFWCTIH